MQTVAAFTAAVRGIVYVNGRFAGECAPEAPLIMPVSPEAMLYGEFRPMDPRYIPCAGAVKISGGRADENDLGDGLCMVQWPGNVLEIEFLPRSAYTPESEYGMADGFPAAVLRGEGTLLRISGQSVGLPAGAALPDGHIAGDCHVFLGRAGKGRYMACFDNGDMTPLGVILADRIESGEEGGYVCFTDLDDIVGHVRMETWDITGAGPEMQAMEYGWARGGPDWPGDAENAALAAGQAAVLGLWDEAEGYLAGHQRGKGILKRIFGEADGCVALKYRAPGARMGVGILRQKNPRLSCVEAIYFRAISGGGTQGAWTVEFSGE